MAFCEDCGSPLTPGAAFCENCGARIVTVPLSNDAGGSSENPVIVKKEITETGIIYTNLKLLSETSGYSIQTLNTIITQFINDAAERAVGYELMDVSQSINGLGLVSEHVGIIRNYIQSNPVKYIFILGSYNVIPSITWDNEAQDKKSDQTVTSDLPYSTMDTASPFLGQSYNFDNTPRVGRLPNINFENYFENLKKASGKVDKTRTFALSAETWESETEYLYSKFINGPSLYTSPDIVVNNVKTVIPDNSNLLLFNLHGNRRTEYWYGQRENNTPEAMDHTSLCNIKNQYFLAVEACYGAFYEGKTKENSILLAALNEKCVTFLGSSRIAFGLSEPYGGWADIVCGEFVNNMKNGLSAGDALNEARKKLIETNKGGAMQKSLAEFDLYGDPSARMFGKTAEDGLKNINDGVPGMKGFESKSYGSSFTRTIRIPMPDVRRAVKLELAKVDEKIAAVIEGFVYGKYKDLSTVSPVYYENKNTRDLSAVFEKETQIGPKMVIVDFDKSGAIKQYMESK